MADSVPHYIRQYAAEYVDIAVDALTRKIIEQAQLPPMDQLTTSSTQKSLVRDNPPKTSSSTRNITKLVVKEFVNSYYDARILEAQRSLLNRTHATQILEEEFVSNIDTSTLNTVSEEMVPISPMICSVTSSVELEKLDISSPVTTEEKMEWKEGFDPLEPQELKVEESFIEEKSVKRKSVTIGVKTLYDKLESKSNFPSSLEKHPVAFKVENDITSPEQKVTEDDEKKPTNTNITKMDNLLEPEVERQVELLWHHFVGMFIICWLILQILN